MQDSQQENISKFHSNDDGVSEDLREPLIMWHAGVN